jgi:prepilin-type N-terminal cleavage/methylation domain-containing protein
MSKRSVGECGRQHPGGGWTLVELLVVLAILALLFALLLPALNASRQAAFRVRCQSNLRGWGQAIHAYLAVRERYPPAATWREGERPDRRPIPARHSLFTYLLPFYDQQPLSQQVDLRRDWNSAANERWTKQWLGGILICPAAPEGRYDKHPSDYTMAVRVDPSDGTGLGSLLRAGLVRDRSGRGPPNWGTGETCWEGLLTLDGVDYRRGTPLGGVVRPRDVRDGTSKTALLFENAGKPLCYRDGRLAACHITRFRWASPTIWMTINDVCRQQQLVNCHNNSQPYGFHRGGLYSVHADGAVHWISEQMAPDTFVAAITRAGEDER